MIVKIVFDHGCNHMPNTKYKTHLYETKVLRALRTLKHEPFGKIVVPCVFDGLRYKLILLTAECRHRKNLMHELGRWRKENEEWFPAKFKITTLRTTKWFKEKVIGAPDRLLFLIKVRNRYIGHVGLFRFDFRQKMCQIDNILRGKPGYPGIMGNAILHMIDWGKKQLGLVAYTLRVASDNKRACRLYGRLGFVEYKRIPLIQIAGKDGLEWVDAPKGYTKKIKRYDMHMKRSSR